MILRKANLSNLKVIDNEIIEKFIPNWEEFKDDPSAARIAADYFLGVVMILAFVTSTSLNPLTLLFNYRQGGRLKAVRILFILLSTCDFLTNIYRPLQIGYRFLSPHLYPLIRPGTLTEQVESFIFRVVVFSSLVLTTSISVCRLVNVKFPFYKVSCKAVLVFCSCSFLAALLIYWKAMIGLPRPKKTYYLLHRQAPYAHNTEQQMRHFVPFVFFSALLCFLGAVGVTSSLVTVICLMNRKGRVENEESTIALRKSSQAILIMNIGNALMIPVQVAYTYYSAHVPLISVLGAFAMAIILSALNPLIRICLSQEMKSFILKLLRW